MMPGSGMVEPDVLPHLWSPFFANAVVKLGRVETAHPVALYYDPFSISRFSLTGCAWMGAIAWYQFAPCLVSSLTIRTRLRASCLPG